MLKFQLHPIIVPVAILLLLVYVTHNGAQPEGGELTDTIGFGKTVTVTCFVVPKGHNPEVVTTTLYIVLDDGVTVMADVVKEPGVQKYVTLLATPTTLALIIVLFPEQIESFPTIDTVG